MTGAPRLKVGLLSPCYWPEVRRGSERFLHDLGVELDARGHDAVLVTSHRGTPAISEEDGIRVVRLPRPRDHRLTRRKLEDHLTHVPLSYAALRMVRPDVAHAVYPTDALAAARYTRITGRPSVLSYMGIPDRVGLMWRRRRLDITQRALSGCSAVVALSRSVRDAFHYWLGFEARYIHPGVDLEAFRPVAERTPEPTLLCAAEPTEPRKRIPLLLEAFAGVRREHPRAQLWLSRPRDRAAVNGLAELPGVRLIDVDDRAAMVEAYGRAWVSVLPSFGEAFGLVLVEAMACGTPVVATRLDTTAEVVDREETGRLFGDGPGTPGEPRELERALLETLELARDPGTREACRAHAARFSPARTADEYEELYRELLASA